MSWFKVDDTAHSHPKLRGAGTAAIGLWTLGGSYAAQYLTDGIVHAHFVKTNGTPAQRAKLVTAGLWHPAGHDCPRCPQPAKGDFFIHDYLIYNPTRAKVLGERARAAEKKRKQRSGAGAADSGSDSSAKSNQMHDASEGKNTSNGTYNNQPDNPDLAGQSDVSPGDSLGTSRARVNPTRPDPSVPPAEEQTKEPASWGSEPAHIGDRPRIPPNCQPLVDALTAARLIVGWDLKPTEWFLIEALIARCGISTLVISATGSWQGARTQPRSGNYFLPAWRALPDAVDRPGANTLPAVVGGDVVPFGPPAHGSGPRRSTTDDRVQQALEVGRRLQAIHDAKTQENQ
ncbi:mucin-2 [Streptomyces sp. NPDC087850]|uniref:mucin-2 n=1 Tax=Streptomyces sp. NPDC087850 TaxID=3365809 RepID=UPI0037FEDE76